MKTKELLDKIKEHEKLLQEQEKAKPSPEKEGGFKEKWNIKDFSDQIEDWKKIFGDKYDETKMQGMIDRATQIAKKSTEKGEKKGASRQEVLGILQGFFQEKG